MEKKKWASQFWSQPQSVDKAVVSASWKGGRQCNLPQCPSKTPCYGSQRNQKMKKFWLLSILQSSLMQLLSRRILMKENPFTFHHLDYCHRLLNWVTPYCRWRLNWTTVLQSLSMAFKLGGTTSNLDYWHRLFNWVAPPSLPLLHWFLNWMAVFRSLSLAFKLGGSFFHRNF